jgi:hypothetical protein
LYAQLSGCVGSDPREEVRPVRRVGRAQLEVAAVAFVFALSVFAALRSGRLRPAQFATVVDISQAQFPRTRSFSQNRVSKWDHPRKKKWGRSDIANGSKASAAARERVADVRCVAAHARLPCNLGVVAGMPGLRGLRCKSNAVESDVEISGLRIRADGGAIDKRVGADRRPMAKVSGSFQNDQAAIRTCDLKLELLVGGIER